MTPTVRDRVSTLDSTLAELDQRLARLAAKEAELEAKIERTARLARGTLSGDQLPSDEATKPGRTRAKRDAMQTPAPVTESPETQLEDALRTRPSSLVDLAKRLDAPVGRVSAMVGRLRKAGRVMNVGTADAPRWTWVVGPECSTEELYRAVEGLITERPMLFAELLTITGNERGRVSSVLVNLQRKGRPVTNLGTDRRARWYIPARPLAR